MLSLSSNTFNHGILAAVSGGADSVALLLLLVQFLPPDGKLAVAHVNHGLRGKNSDADAEFVRALAMEYQFRYFEHRLDAGATLSENAARNLRYDFLVNQAEQIGFRYLATAHTADDQTETVLHRILRGTGLSGLSGIAPSRVMTPAVTLLRPLLHVRRSKILTYLESLGKTYRDDKTNFENRFTRNRIRNRLLPMLREEFNPQIDEAVCRLATLAAGHELVLAELLDGLIDVALVEQLPNRIVLDVLPLQHYSLPIHREVLIRAWKGQNFPQLEMDYGQWSALAELLQKPDGRLDFPGGVTAERKDERLTISLLPNLTQ
ncbi:MAG: tRNA lysidine(34) synthetase TilS [Planctomycetaceae bacterium]|nr:tRNA lysidine(34) synthetase TilS [Planctomycetaceae bacterium]